MSTVSEQTTTDRAIEELELMKAQLISDRDRTCSDCVKTRFAKRIDSLSLAITALESQSEAERKIEKARKYCEKAISDIGHTRPYVAACEDILQILEGKADV